TDDGAHDAEERRVPGRGAGGDEADDTDERGDEIEVRRELGALLELAAVALDAGHGGDTGAAALVRLAVTLDAGLAPSDRHDEGGAGGERHAGAGHLPQDDRLAV